MTVSRRPPSAAEPGPRQRAGRGVRDRARDVLAAVRGPARADRGLPAARRGAGRARSAARWCRPAWSTPPQGAREAGDRFARRAGRPRALPRRHLRDVEPRCCPPSRRRRRRSCCSASSRRRRSTTRTSTPASGWPTARPAACRRSRARSRARGSRTTRSPGTIDDDERAWAKIAAWVRAAGVARALRRARIGFLGHIYPGMLDMYSDFTAVHAQLGAHVEVLEIDDLGARVAPVGDAGGRGQARPRSARCSTSPTRRTTRSRGRSSDDAARLVGARRRRARPARGRLRARRADLLLPRDRRQRGRAARRRRDRRQLAADRARRSRPPARATSRRTSPS